MSKKLKKKIKSIRSEVTKFDGDTITLKLHDDIDVDKVRELAVDGHYYTYLDFYEKDTITDLQRDHYFALIGDLHEFNGFPKDVLDSQIRFEFMSYYLLDEYPSLSRGSMRKSTASELIQFVIDYCIQNGIPFRKQQFYLTADTSRMLFALTMKRLCLVCGKENSQLHHVDAVGAGRDRTKVDHTKHEFLMLCPTHHQEIHTMKNKDFFEKYYVKPVKLNERQLKELNIQGNYEE